MDKLDKAGLFGKKQSQGKNDYEEGGLWHALFLAPKIKKNCSTINKIGIINEHKTFKSFTNVGEKLDRKEYFTMANGGTLRAKVPLSWKIAFIQGVVVPHKIIQTLW